MKHGMAGAWGLGVAVLTAAYGLWFVVLQSKQYFEALVYVLWLSPFVAALLCAYRAPEKRVIIGFSMVARRRWLKSSCSFVGPSCLIISAMGLVGRVL